MAGFGLGGARLSLIKVGENVTYRASAGRGTAMLLRLHRPIYHEPDEVRSELQWLEALACTTDLQVPRPIRSPHGELLVLRPLAGGQPHVCTLLQWVPGRQHHGPPKPRHLRALGQTTAMLHRHALDWRPPAGFRRKKLDWKGLLGRHSNWGRLPVELPELFSAADRRVVRDALSRIESAMSGLDRIDGARALIHADLHFGNVVFTANRAAPIDFDDAGFGYLMYDVATSLTPYVESPRWPELRDALLAGYADVRPLPEPQLAVLPEFLAARNLTMAVWLTLRQPLIHRLPRDLGPFLARTAGLCRQIAG